MDANLKIAGLLRDLASVQSSRHSKWGYKHAASAVMNLPVPIESMRNPDGTFQKIAHVGPSSTRVIREFLDTGASETVDQAVAASGKAAEIEGRRHWQLQFLSRAKVLAANDPGSADKDTVSLQDLRADFTGRCGRPLKKSGARFGHAGAQAPGPAPAGHRAVEPGHSAGAGLATAPDRRALPDQPCPPAARDLPRLFPRRCRGLARLPGGL